MLDRQMRLCGDDAGDRARPGRRLVAEDLRNLPFDGPKDRCAVARGGGGIGGRVVCVCGREDGGWRAVLVLLVAVWGKNRQRISEDLDVAFGEFDGLSDVLSSRP